MRIPWAIQMTVDSSKRTNERWNEQTTFHFRVISLECFLLEFYCYPRIICSAPSIRFALHKSDSISVLYILYNTLYIYIKRVARLYNIYDHMYTDTHACIHSNPVTETNTSKHFDLEI